MHSRKQFLPTTTAKDIPHPWLTQFCLTITDSLYLSGFRLELNVSSTIHNRTIPSSIKYIHWPTSVNSPALSFLFGRHARIVIHAIAYFLSIQTSWSPVLLDRFQADTVSHRLLPHTPSTRGIGSQLILLIANAASEQEEATDEGEWEFRRWLWNWGDRDGFGIGFLAPSFRRCSVLLLLLSVALVSGPP